jgi:hypothetical protein
MKDSPLEHGRWDYHSWKLTRLLELSWHKRQEQTTEVPFPRFRFFSPSPPFQAWGGHSKKLRTGQEKAPALLSALFANRKTRQG